MRLFTALWPPAAAVAPLRAALDAAAGPDAGGLAGWRRTDVASWHVTLAFHGDAAQPGPLAEALAATAAGLAAPRLRIAGCGAFPGVVWAGVEAEPVAALHALVTAADGATERFVPHLTVLRRRGRSVAPRAVTLPDVPGPWWRPVEVLVVATEREPAGPRYRVVHRVGIGGADAQVTPHVRPPDRAW